MSEILFLRFTDTSQAMAALAQAGVTARTDTAGRQILPDDGALDGVSFALSVVGGDGVVRRPCESGPGGTEQPPIAIEGYHVNMIFGGPPPEILRQWTVTPSHPQEIFCLSR